MVPVDIGKAFWTVFHISLHATIGGIADNNHLVSWCLQSRSRTLWVVQKYGYTRHYIPFKIAIWVWVNTYRYIFSGMNIHLPAILGFTRYQGFDPSPFKSVEMMIKHLGAPNWLATFIWVMWRSRIYGLQNSMVEIWRQPLKGIEKLHLYATIYVFCRFIDWFIGVSIHLLIYICAVYLVAVDISGS